MPEVTGSVNAEFTAKGGSTQLQCHTHAYPLKIAKTFPFEGQLGVYLMDASPGVMAGDRYELVWRFGENTNVFVTNQSYTKVHPSKKDGGTRLNPSAQSQSLSLHRGAYVEYMPEPLMLYKDASFASDMTVQMEEGASLFLSDIVCPGRTHRGEVFHYERYQSRLTVRYGNELIFSTKQRVEPQLQVPRQIARWDSHTHTGTLYLFSERVNANVAEALRERLAQQDSLRPGLYYGISLTYKFGLAVSVLGVRVYEIEALLKEAWTFLRSEVFNRNPLFAPK
ncbi:urease accessory protein UreD [Paenibacillus naphthalenovorans]|uniref:Urease accessory protein UreD n=1 Tax=Paenibacillus naphthalenovorans TaxID=162209 RepID=A0A0U2VME5_9BACL|nr:urease accessory protein UreD [Paenibacillus naphthalenovorans]ALS20663.1 urease accessory protein UreD [Paenibacillus naphthalenovorans]